MSGRVIICAICLLTSALAADDELRFTDITLQAGAGGPTERDRLGGHGAMFADVDDDSLTDLYITMIFNNPMPDLFFDNLDGRRFANAGKQCGIADFDGGSHGACFADLDNDGDYDLFNGTTWDHSDFPAVNNIFRNDGRGRFLDVTAHSNIPPERRWPTRGVLTFDMDGDGDLDLFCVTNYQGSADPPDERNEVYRNDGSLKFQPIRGGDLFWAPCGQGATDTDFDSDGDIDVIAANRTGSVNVLQNDGKGNFNRVDSKSIGIQHRAGDGISMADVDNDGDLDMLLATADVGHLYLNQGDGTLKSWQSFADTDGYMGGFADLDNDGDVDLVFAGDDVSYLNDGAGRFAKGPRIPVRGINDPRGIAFADIDNDGDLDFAVGCKRSRNWLVRNELDSGNWLKVRLVSPQGQAGAFGAKTRIYKVNQTGKALLGTREARSSNGYLGQNDPVLHFGLGVHKRVDLVVRFLDGTTVKRPGVDANQTIGIDGRQP
ncbi:MAG: CRTAC1 family protein [Pirellulaceae bacterium]|nr:CRTAC1 family protein [Pirellulaceae bacterium]